MLSNFSLTADGNHQEPAERLHPERPASSLDQNGQTFPFDDVISKWRDVSWRVVFLSSDPAVLFFKINLSRRERFFCLSSVSPKSRTHAGVRKR